VTSDSKLICSVYFKPSSGVGEGPGLLKFNTDGSVAESILLETTDPNGIDMCCGFGMEFGDTNSELLISSSRNGLKIFMSDLTGNVTLKSTPSVQGFDAATSETDYTIKNLVKMSGKIYAIVYSWYDDNTYFAELDLTGNKLIHIGKLSADDTFQYQGMAIIPGNLF
jgi:hypothetical protein